MKQRWIQMLSGVLAAALLLALPGCGNKRNFGALKLKDGTYEGRYADEDEGDHAGARVTVKLTVSAGRITACESVEMEADGTVKDEHYGEKGSPQSYQLAQKALDGLRTYPDQLLTVQDPEKLDAVAGATVSLKRFREAVWNALDQAK